MRRPRSRALLTVLALFAAGALLPSAFAKGPDAGEMPTLEQIYRDAEAKKKAAEAEAAAAQRDPRRELIQAYRTGAAGLDKYKALTEIINDSKTESVQSYRQPAAEALIERFRVESTDDPIVRRIRADVALEVIDLMKASSSDEIGLNIVQGLLYTWWKQKMQEIRFKAGDKWRDRAKAHRRMKAYLAGGE